MTATTHYTFDTDTAGTRIGDHEYGLELSDRWSTLGGTLNGGYLLATALQALRDELPQPDLLSASAHFLRPGTPGPALVHTEIARIGRRTATGQAILTRDDREIIRVLATFTDLAVAQGPTFVRNAPPTLPAPEQCLDPLRGVTPAGATIAERVEFRMPQLAGF